MQKQYPFKFLDSYEREDKDFFFGRKVEIEDLYQMIFQTKIMLVYGTSGTGKTSLIQCGLANKFQTYDWAPLFIRRENNIINALDKCLCNESDGVHHYSEGDGKTIKELSAKIDAVYKASFKPIYLIFDQFEELYVLGSADEQANFISVIQQILGTNQPVKIIISIREEYLGYLYNFEKEVPELLRKKLRIEPMNREKVRLVIEGFGNEPNSLVSLQLGEERKIADTIFERLKGDEKTLTIQLPYLQVFLDKFYMEVTGDETRQSEAIFTLETLKKIGDIGDVLRNFLDEQVLKISLLIGQKPETLWNILSPFVTLDGTKEPLSLNDLFDRFSELDRQTIENVIEHFKKSRILRFTEKAQLYEITHDSLAKQVNSKRSDEEIAILEVQRLVRSQVAVKEEAREFFTEKQLLFIEPYLEKFKETKEEADWIEKSRKNVEEQKRLKKSLEEAERAKERERKEVELIKARKWLRRVLALLGLVVIALGFAWYAYNQATKSEEKAKSESEKAKQSALIAQENLINSYRSDSIRFRREMDMLNKNIETFTNQYNSGQDVIAFETKKIEILKSRIDSLYKNITIAKLRKDSLSGKNKEKVE